MTSESFYIDQAALKECILFAGKQAGIFAQSVYKQQVQKQLRQTHPSRFAQSVIGAIDTPQPSVAGYQVKADVVLPSGTQKYIIDRAIVLQQDNQHNGGVWSNPGGQVYDEQFKQLHTSTAKTRYRIPQYQQDAYYFIDQAAAMMNAKKVQISENVKNIILGTLMANKSNWLKEG